MVDNKNIIQGSFSKFLVGIAVAALIPTVAGFITYGSLQERVASNAKEIDKVYHDGCAPSIEVRAQLKGMEVDFQHINKAQQDIVIMQRQILAELRQNP